VKHNGVTAYYPAELKCKQIKMLEVKGNKNDAARETQRSKQIKMLEVKGMRRKPMTPLQPGAVTD
jgi:hypothetical protein